jgi:uncharacterized protein
MRRFRSAIYEGVVVHTRLRPRRHRLRYRIFWLLIDIDELEGLDRAHRLFRYNRPGLIAFADRDHGERDGSALRPWAERKLRSAGLEPDGGPIELLCMPRVLGGVFNPLSVWFCRTRSGVLQAVIYEVNNTFGETHAYVLPVSEPEAPILDQACAKTFRVSPFLPMELHYRFRVEPPGGRAGVSIVALDGEGPVVVASFRGAREELSDGRLLRAWLAHPLLSLKVLAAIHAEGLKIWLKLLGRGRSQRPVPATS